jgi:hypothetical protein
VLPTITVTPGPVSMAQSVVTASPSTISSGGTLRAARDEAE